MIETKVYASLPSRYGDTCVRKHTLFICCETHDPYVLVSGAAGCGGLVPRACVHSTHRGCHAVPHCSLRVRRRASAGEFDVGEFDAVGRVEASSVAGLAQSVRSHVSRVC